MSYAYSSYMDCPNLQEALVNQFEHDPQVVQDALGLLNFINSGYNTQGILQSQIAPGKGKIRKVELRYQPRFQDASSSSADIDCAGGDEYGDTTTTYEIDSSVGKSRTFTITPKLLATRCEDDAAWLAKQIQAHMDKLARDMNVDAADYAAANLGHFLDGSTSKNTKTKLSSGAYTTDLSEDVVAELQFIEWANPVPFIFGDGLLTKYMRAREAACCALNAVDLASFVAQNPIAFMRDVNVATSLGNANAFLTLGAGAIQMLKYNEFDGALAMINDSGYKQGVIVDPKTGIPYDYYAKLDCGVWNFQLKLAYKFVTLPEDMYLTNDRLNGTNGILKFVINNS